MKTATCRLDPEFLAAALNVARIGICFVDDKGLFIEVNPAFCELTEFSRDELIGKSWTLAAPPDIAAQANRFLAAVLSDSSRIPGQWKMKRKGGALFDALASFRPLERDGKRSLSTGRPGRQRWCTASCVPTAACAGSATARSRELGANDYITKPFKLDELLAAIRKRLDA